MRLPIAGNLRRVAIIGAEDEQGGLAGSLAASGHHAASNPRLPPARGAPGPDCPRGDRSALAEVQSSLRKTNGKLRAAREEMRFLAGSACRAELAEARGEVERCAGSTRATRCRGGPAHAAGAASWRGCPGRRELLELADAAAAVRDLPVGYWCWARRDRGTRGAGAAGGAERVDVPVNGVLPDGPSALAYLAGPRWTV